MASLRDMEEADAELNRVQSSVKSVMRDKGLDYWPNPVNIPIRDMRSLSLLNLPLTKGTYTIGRDGTVIQVTNGYE